MTKTTDELVVYQTATGALEVRFDTKQDTVWLTQAHMVALFGRDQSVISRHIRNVLAKVS